MKDMLFLQSGKTKLFNIKAHVKNKISCLFKFYKYILIENIDAFHDIIVKEYHLSNLFKHKKKKKRKKNMLNKF